MMEQRNELLSRSLTARVLQEPVGQGLHACTAEVVVTQVKPAQGLAACNGTAQQGNTWSNRKHDRVSRWEGEMYGMSAGSA